jgi:hypothetical protein
MGDMTPMSHRPCVIVAPLGPAAEPPVPQTAADEPADDDRGRRRPILVRAAQPEPAQPKNKKRDCRDRSFAMVDVLILLS